MNSYVLDHQKWASQTLFWQMGNIGLEVSRALKAKKQGNEKRMTAAFYRGMDLINATIIAWVERGKSPYELLIAREQFAKSILSDELDETLEKYFLNFAIANKLNDSRDLI